MSNKTKRILAITALVFMSIFSVSFIMFLIKPDMFGGAIAFITLFSGVIGIGLFFVIKGLTKDKSDAGTPESDGGEAESDGDSTDSPESPESGESEIPPNGDSTEPAEPAEKK
jgi:hypothetical protein